MRALPSSTPLTLHCDDPRDRFAGAQAAFALAQAVGLPRPRCLAAALCAAELASNAARHARDGELSIRPLPDGSGIEIVCEDRGPGVSEPEAALTDGWSRGRALLPHDARSEGLGAGLGSVQRLASSFSIEARAGGGATAIARISR